MGLIYNRFQNEASLFFFTYPLSSGILFYNAILGHGGMDVLEVLITGIAILGMS